ncbi:MULTISPECIES: hypothetical protein [unclassified Amycolatopsis]|uniref:hypothetical protein n=1 Tax=unclassified Amycolatopsis TaxID=2618356 RepID=UPI00287623BA|nr:MULTISPECIES: hypothetical protein [unclassified Amycolatopsis]MDS0139647.1 hypothetical protein [Amycolatopsis sp. 505]MDS0145070.1 hypothetical protein [Amycolatopsis sp. CM201R]
MTMTTPTPYARQTGLFSGASLWRAARPALMLIAAASLGLAAGTAELRWVLGSAALAVVLTMTAVIAVCRRRVAEKPARLVFLAECELATLVCAAVALLATTVNVVAWVSEHFDSKSLAYGIGLLAGGLLGFLSKDLFKAGENESWNAGHFQVRAAKVYQPYFYRRDPQTRRYQGHNTLARWMPDGLAADALRMYQYRDASGEYVTGWNHAARMRRARTVEAELARPPWNPSPNGVAGQATVVDHDLELPA